MQSRSLDRRSKAVGTEKTRRVLRYSEDQPWLERDILLPLPPILTPKDVGALLGGVHPSTVSRQRRKGLLKGARKLGRRFFFITTELIEGLKLLPSVGTSSEVPNPIATSPGKEATHD